MKTIKDFVFQDRLKMLREKERIIHNMTFEQKFKNKTKIIDVLSELIVLGIEMGQEFYPDNYSLEPVEKYHKRVGNVYTYFHDLFDRWSDEFEQTEEYEIEKQWIYDHIPWTVPRDFKFIWRL